MRTARLSVGWYTMVRFLLALVGLICTPPNASGQVLLTQEEALRLAFPEPATVERRTAFLAEDDLAEVRRLAIPAESNGRSVVTYYIGWKDGKPLGVAYFDAHRVRTLQEVLMIGIAWRASKSWVLPSPLSTWPRMAGSNCSQDEAWMTGLRRGGTFPSSRAPRSPREPPRLRCGAAWRFTR